MKAIHKAAAIRPGEKLTVERCVQVALRNSPNILAASHTVNAVSSRLAEAWSGYYPQITLSGGYTTKDTVLTITRTVTALRQDGYSGERQLSRRTIVDFGRTEDTGIDPAEGSGCIARGPPGHDSPDRRST